MRQLCRDGAGPSPPLLLWVDDGAMTTLENPTQLPAQLSDETADSVPRVGVMLPLPIGGAPGGVYDYRRPAGLDLQPGDFVEVPLGRRSLVGVVWHAGEGDVAPERLKEVMARLDLPPLPAVSRRLIDWVANYCMAAPGAVLRMAMSVPEAFLPPRSLKAWRVAPGLDPALFAPAGSDKRKLSPQRQRVLEVLAHQPPLQSVELAREAGVSHGVIKQMGESGLIEAVDLPQRPSFGKPDAARNGHDLSPEQRRIADDLSAAVAAGTYSATLLDGVTGSGKTEVYFEAIAACLREGRQALVLLPEIALGAQWLRRFEARFGALPAMAFGIDRIGTTPHLACGAAGRGLGRGRGALGIVLALSRPRPHHRR